MMVLPASFATLYIFACRAPKRISNVGRHSQVCSVSKFSGFSFAEAPPSVFCLYRQHTDIQKGTRWILKVKYGTIREHALPLFQNCYR